MVPVQAPNTPDKWKMFLCLFEWGNQTSEIFFPLFLNPTFIILADVLTTTHKRNLNWNRAEGSDGVVTPVQDQLEELVNKALEKILGRDEGEGRHVAGAGRREPAGTGGGGAQNSKPTSAGCKTRLRKNATTSSSRPNPSSWMCAWLEVRATTGAGAGVSQQGTSEELTTVIETLVSDNETLKRDNAERQTLIADAREDCWALQEEVEDGRVNPGVGIGSGSAGISRGRPVHLQLWGHFHTGSMPAAMLSPEPLTPETNRRPLSPADSATTSLENRYVYFGQLSSHNASDDGHRNGQQHDNEESEEKRVATPHKPLFLLARSRGVKTDPYPYPAPTATAVTPTLGHYPPSRSPSSATPESERVGGAHDGAAAADAAADALSLTNRLKRAQIRGADVNHLSRSTVTGILADVPKQLRTAGGEAQGVGLAECAPGDVWGDGGGGAGSGECGAGERGGDRSGKAAARAAQEGEHGHEKEKAGAAGWMVPLSKLFAGSPAGPSNTGSGSSKADGGVDRNSTASPLAAPRPLAHLRFGPKLGPALAASATTMNVEFSGSGAGGGRAMTSTSMFDAAPALTSSSIAHGNASAQQPALMGICAGAPVPLGTCCHLLGLEIDSKSKANLSFAGNTPIIYTLGI
ncbi:hypothetical protein B0H16DRAFT_1446444 [Mycena metata]|uniref:Uncharacterized protein n=1 Tax=Mycena metata TaxID=1033252 RepID=A0AAD7P1S5_9AGAR|nr:hypothetical protein B0H16DRAFT_1446444 [Mycena metata]